LKGENPEQLMGINDFVCCVAVGRVSNKSTPTESWS